MNYTKLLLRTAGNFLTFLATAVLTFTYAPIIYSEVMFKLSPPNVETDYKMITDNVQIFPGVNSGFEFQNIVPVQPVDKDFSIIIEKIGVNAPVVANVSTINEREYMEALRNGVAHAKGTALPGKPGNGFYFAHSSLNFWQLGPYATVFNLLSKLEVGDYIYVYYEGKGYIYEVFESDIVPGWNTTPFTTEYSEPVITLITCSPPGTTRNRLVVKAKLI